MLSRQNLEALNESVFGEILKGVYLLKESKNAQITLVASGSEVAVCIKAAQILEQNGISVNVASAPCFELIANAPKQYLERVFAGKVLAIEAASALEWYKYADCVLGMDSFGESGDANELFRHFGFSAENIANKASDLIK